jgi:hypothetical protein
MSKLFLAIVMAAAIGAVTGDGLSATLRGNLVGSLDLVASSALAGKPVHTSVVWQACQKEIAQCQADQACSDEIGVAGTPPRRERS